MNLKKIDCQIFHQFTMKVKAVTNSAATTTPIETKPAILPVLTETETDIN